LFFSVFDHVCHYERGPTFAPLGEASPAVAAESQRPGSSLGMKILLFGVQLASFWLMFEEQA
jgi:hypothetical protein